MSPYAVEFMVEATEVPSRESRTLSLSIREGTLWSVMEACGNTYIIPFALFLHAGNFAVALIASMPALLGSLAQVGTTEWMDRRAMKDDAPREGRRLSILVSFVALQALSFIPLFLVPYFFPDPAIAVPAVVMATVLFVVGGSGVAPAWTSLMGDVVPAETRGEYFGHRARIVILVIFIATLLAGLILDRFEHAGLEWAGFGTLFAIALLARLWSARLLSLHYDAPYRPSREAGFSFWDFLRRTPQSNFMKFTFYVAFMNGAIMISGPFFAVYMLRDLGFSYTEFTLNQAVLLLASTLSIRWWGAMGDRYGNRSVIVATGFLLPVMPLLWAFTTGFYGTLAIQVLAGLSWSGFGIATQNYIFDAVTSEKRARVIGYHSVVNGVFSVIGGTMVGGYLAEHLPVSYSIAGHHVALISSLPAVFICSSVLRLLVAIVMLPLFREVRPVEPISPGRLILRLSSGEPISEAISNAVERVSSYKKDPPS